MRRSLRGAVSLQPANEARKRRRLQTGPRNRRRPGRCRQCPGLPRGHRVREQADARLTGRMPGKGQANFALPCAVDYVKRQPFRVWKGGRVV
jgi:hypothetical protein